MSFSERIYKFRISREMTHQAFADAVGVSRGAVQQWETGATAPKRKNQPAVANFMGITVSELMADDQHQLASYDESSDDWPNDPTVGQLELRSTKPHPLGGNWSHSVLTQAPLNPAIDLDNNPEYPAIRRVNIKAQAGVSGYAVEHMGDDGPPIVFRADWYKGKGYKPDKMLALRVTGESMIPSLYEGDLIVINTEQAQPKQGVPFLVSYEGEVVVKRMVRDDGLWWLTSDNPDQRRYPRTKCNGETQIIGEVVYRQTERI